VAARTGKKASYVDLRGGVGDRLVKEDLGSAELAMNDGMRQSGGRQPSEGLDICPT
jgi:hypothetical protein